jgi:uncharacterized protein (TIGR03000 family)
LFGGHGCSGGGHSLFGGHGCSGSCSCSCSGGGHRLFGGHGGHGCSGSCHGYSSCSGCCGGCSGYVVCSGCTGYIGCAGCAGGMAPPPPKGEKLDMPKEKKDDKKKDEVSTSTVVLSLPADAKVSIDGVATMSSSATRTFVTPELKPAREYVYTVSAEIVRDGQTLTISEQVTVRAGEETRVTFGIEKFTALTVAAK